jgi:hypothetical protein
MGKDNSSKRQRKMRLQLTTILFLLTINLYGQSDLGIGLVSINFDDKTVLNFYESQIATTPTKTIEFFDDNNYWNIRDLDKQKQWLNPEVLWLEYNSFIFRCKSLADDWVEIIVNNETGKNLWLKKSEVAKFSNWETYLQGMFGVARLSDQNQKIRKQPSDSSEEIKYSGGDCFQVKSMNGDWIEIYTAEYCDESYTDSKTKIKSGWIKWRQGNKLLIEYHITA